MIFECWFLLTILCWAGANDVKPICQDYSNFIDVRIGNEGCLDSNETTVSAAENSNETSVSAVENSSNMTTTIAAENNTSIANTSGTTTDDYIPSCCEEALRMSGRPHGLHLIRIPNSQIKPFYVNCIEDPAHEGGAWTLIQRHEDGSIDFFRKWSDYQHGFGNLETEFFIGLDKLHALTNSGKHELWIEMENFERSRRYVMYSSFAIGDESQAYALIMLGNYRGNAGDALRWHAGEKFTAKDVDNDSNDRENCAMRFQGAWWYKSCLRSNLNGIYARYLQNGEGITWNTFRKRNDMPYPLKYVHMAIRQVKDEF